MENIIITKATGHDIDTLVRIGRETFFETFADSNTPENIQNYLDNNFTESKFRDALNNEGSSFFIAWDSDKPAAYLKLNTGDAQTEKQGEAYLEIERIYVKASYHGKKVGQLLYQKSEEVARSKNKRFIWLGVWEENLKAIRFYEKNGFEAYDTHIFKMGEEEQTDFMMKKEL